MLTNKQIKLKRLYYHPRTKKHFLLFLKGETFAPRKGKIPSVFLLQDKTGKLKIEFLETFKKNYIESINVSGKFTVICK